MTEEEKSEREEKGEISRREFLKDAGLIVGGAAIGSTVLLAACGDGEATTETVTQTQTQTQTQTVTTTQQVGEVTTTVTETVSKFICPIDGTEFDTLTALQAHFAAAHPGEAIEIPGLITLTVNGETQMVLNVKPYYTLAFVLRERLGLTGTKVGCDRGDCGTCTVIVDGQAVYSCLMLAMDAVGKDILTIEGLADGLTLHPVQQAFYDYSAVQCGYCQPGYIMAAVALKDEKPNPTLDEVKEGLSGHICPCGHTTRMVEAVLGGY